MKIIFMGTPDFARVVLSYLVNSDNTVACVVTQPDKPKGRGYGLTPTPVKAYALEHGIEVLAPNSLKNGELLPALEKYNPDAVVVAAYGKILPPYVIEYAKYGCINVHGSLLPKYRGAAPIQRAIMDGDGSTGITIMKMDNGLDTGDMLLKESTPIAPDDNFETLHDRLAEIGGKLVLCAIDKIEHGEIIPQKQDDSCSTYAKKIEKADCLLDFCADAKSVWCKIRGLSPVPLAFAFLRGKMVKIIDAEYSAKEYCAPPGSVVSVDGGKITVSCKNGSVCITRLLPEGKSRMSAADFINGRQVGAGDIFTLQREKK